MFLRRATGRLSAGWLTTRTPAVTRPTRARRSPARTRLARERRGTRGKRVGRDRLLEKIARLQVVVAAQLDEPLAYRRAASGEDGSAARTDAAASGAACTPRRSRRRLPARVTTSKRSVAMPLSLTTSSVSPLIESCTRMSTRSVAALPSPSVTYEPSTTRSVPRFRRMEEASPRRTNLHRPVPDRL